MFVEAIEKAKQFTRPIHSIARNYGSTVIQPGAATLFFVNEHGSALTCSHVAKQLLGAAQLSQKRQAFNDELEKRRGEKKEKQLIRELERKYGFSKTFVFELHNRFMNCIEGSLDAEIKLHDKLDVALIQFTNFSRILCETFPVFAANGGGLKQGKFLCRLGYPFPEFTNYAYDSATDSLQWTTNGKANTPRFPIEGMVTRRLLGDDSGTIGFELSTPGLRGQSGGPAFDTEGVIWGMQAATNHLDLNFDVNQEVLRNGVKKKVIESALLHVGHCVHVDILKSFMTQNGVQFQEA